MEFNYFINLNKQLSLSRATKKVNIMNLEGAFNIDHSLQVLPEQENERVMKLLNSVVSLRNIFSEQALMKEKKFEKTWTDRNCGETLNFLSKTIIASMSDKDLYHIQGTTQGVKVKFENSSNLSRIYPDFDKILRGFGSLNYCTFWNSRVSLIKVKQREAIRQIKLALQ